MAMGLALTAEGVADIWAGNHLMSSGEKQQQPNTTGKQTPLTKKDKAVTTRAQKNANLKRMGLENVKLRNKSYSSGKKSLQKAGFKPTNLKSDGVDSATRRAFKNENGTVVSWDPANVKTGRKAHWHINDSNKFLYTYDGKRAFWQSERNFFQ